MREVVPFIIVAAFAAVVVGIARWQRAQTERMRAIASAAGLQVDTSSKKPPALGFDLFDRGSARRMQAQMWRAGEHDSVFQYRYTEGSGDHSRTHRCTAAIVEVPFAAPHLAISTENWWTRTKRMVGLRDIEIESPQFNERYHVRSRDERFAVALLDPPMIAWMLSPSSGLGTVSFEFCGVWMLVHCDQLDLDELPAMLTWARSARDQLPAVLTELYGRTA